MMVILPSRATEANCYEDQYDDIKKRCDETSEMYGGPEACKDLFDSFIKIPCVRDDNANIDDLLSKVDKSLEILSIYCNLDREVTFDFSKLPSKMKIILQHSIDFEGSQESRLLNSAKAVQNIEKGNKNIMKNVKSNKKNKGEIDYILKINGNHNDKVSYLYLDSPEFEIIGSDLNIDTFAIDKSTFSSLSAFKIKAKEAHIHIDAINANYGNDVTEEGGTSGKYLASNDAYSTYGNYQYETLLFFDHTCYLDERLQKHYNLDGNFVSFEFGEMSYEYDSTIIDSNSIPNGYSKAIGLITGAQKLTLIANKNSFIPDNIIFEFGSYIPIMTPIDSLDPVIYITDEENAAQLLEEYKIVVTKAGDWIGLKKPNITLRLSNDKIKLDTTDIKDIAEINIVITEEKSKKKGLETKYIIVIVVCCVVVVAVVVVVVVVVVLKRKKTKVNNNSASP